MRVPRSLGGLVLASLVVASCGPFVGKAVDVHRDGSIVRLAVEGHNDANTQAWLCPHDPGPGETVGDEGRTRLEGLGCLDLGLAPVPAKDVAGWSTEIDVTTLPADKVLAFASGATAKYRLLLVSTRVGSANTFSADVAAFDLRP